MPRSKSAQKCVFCTGVFDEQIGEQTDERTKRKLFSKLLFHQMNADERTHQTDKRTDQRAKPPAVVLACDERIQLPREEKLNIKLRARRRDGIIE